MKTISLILSLVIIIAGIFTVLWCNKEIRKRKARLIFLQEMIYLDMIVSHGLIEKKFALIIMEKFNEIEQNPSKDPERIRKLRKRFEERFADIIGGL